METKHLIQSKTFWFNALTLASSMAGILPAKYAVPVAAVVNIGLRLISSDEVTLKP